ncbi:MAG TPA: DUF2505 domain-containing protein [Acidimicrobiales bacterium]|nr:DUF2505 domain-containing protein [Acidimicrobiales bacterium]
MDFSAEHRFAAPPDRVAAAMTDPAFAPRLVELPDVGAAEALGSGRDGPVSWLRVRLAYDGQLDPVAQRVLGGDEVAWIQEYRLDAARLTGTVDITPERHQGLLRCGAALRLIPDADGTRRTMTGRLEVRVPLVGGRAERALAPAILRRVDIEADLLDTWMRSGDD